VDKDKKTETSLFKLKKVSVADGGAKTMADHDQKKSWLQFEVKKTGTLPQTKLLLSITPW